MIMHIVLSLCLLFALRIKTSASLVLPENGSVSMTPPGLFQTHTNFSKVLGPYPSQWPSVNTAIPLFPNPTISTGSYRLIFRRYGASFPASLTPAIRESISIIDARLLMGGLPTDGEPLTVQNGRVTMHFVLMEHTPLTAIDLNSAMVLLEFFTDHYGPREVLLAEILTRADWEGQQWESVGAISLAIGDEAEAATEKR